MRFDKIILIGSGKIACDIISVFLNYSELMVLSVYESTTNTLSFLGNICNKNGIPYYSINIDDNVESCLYSEMDGYPSILIISANNRHIFSKKFLSQPKIEVINFHYSYLPYYRGINIPTWVIYNEEKYTGITWHFVTDTIDGGNIIARKKIPLTDYMTAFELSYIGMKEGIKAFEEFIFELLEKPIKGIKINKDELGEIYLSDNLPENGYLNIDSPIGEVYKLLRSFDYGKSHVITPLKVKYKDKIYFVKSYKKMNYTSVYQKSEKEIIKEGESYYIAIKIKELE